MATTSTSFGVLLRTLRKCVGMTQSDLAAAVGYSVALVSALEQERRLPDVTFVVQTLVPALAISDEPQLARRLVELAAAARGERPPTSLLISSTFLVLPVHLEISSSWRERNWCLRNLYLCTVGKKIALFRPVG